MQTNVAVAFLDTRTHGFPGFEHYFRLAPKVPLFPYCTDLHVDRVVQIPDMSLTSLAAAMVANLKPGENVLIYTHAEPNNFVFPIDPTKPKNDFDVKEAANLPYHLDLIDQRQLGGCIIDPFIHQTYGKYVTLDAKKHEKQFGTESPDSYLKIGDATTAQLLQGDLAGIRRKGIGHLAIRACRVGQNKDFMRMLGLLFGAKTVSAPKSRTAAILGGTQAINIVQPENLAKHIIETRAKHHGSGGFHKYEFPSPIFGQNGVNIPYLFSFTSLKTGKTSFQLQQIKATFLDAIMSFLWDVAGYTALLSKDIVPYQKIAMHALQGKHGLIFPKERAYLENLEFIWVKR